MRAINIEWDTDYNEDIEFLPKEIELPDEINEDDIGDYISDATGYCHYGYEICCKHHGLVANDFKKTKRRGIVK